MVRLDDRQLISDLYSTLEIRAKPRFYRPSKPPREKVPSASTARSRE